MQTVEPIVEVYLEVAQLVQLVAPVLAPNEPMGQPEQFEACEAPKVVRKVPAPQLVHEVWPVDVWKKPAEQLMQLA